MSDVPESPGECVAVFRSGRTEPLQFAPERSTRAPALTLTARSYSPRKISALRGFDGGGEGAIR
jgi:hypothetical protein